MKIILVSQRVSEETKYVERRDCIDQRWNEVFGLAGFIPVLMPNNKDLLKSLLEKISPDGLLLTGGNSMVKHGGDAPERDEAEKIALEYAIENKLPVLGVCRGMQFIQDYFGTELGKVSGHVATRIELINESGRFGELYKKFSNVNAYHNLGTTSTSDVLQITATSNKGVVMAVEHAQHKIYGCMWHPERENPINKTDIDHIKMIFGE